MILLPNISLCVKGAFPSLLPYGCLVHCRNPGEAFAAAAALSCSCWRSATEDWDLCACSCLLLLVVRYILTVESAPSRQDKHTCTCHICGVGYTNEGTLYGTDLLKWVFMCVYISLFSIFTNMKLDRRVCYFAGSTKLYRCN